MDLLVSSLLLLLLLLLWIFKPGRLLLQSVALSGITVKCLMATCCHCFGWCVMVGLCVRAAVWRWNDCDCERFEPFTAGQWTTVGQGETCHPLPNLPAGSGLVHGRLVTLHISMRATHTCRLATAHDCMCLDKCTHARILNTCVHPTTAGPGWRPGLWGPEVVQRATHWGANASLLCPSRGGGSRDWAARMRRTNNKYKP